MAKILAIVGGNQSDFRRIQNHFENRYEYQDFSIVHVTSEDDIYGRKFHEYRLSQTYLKYVDRDLIELLKDRLTEDSPCRQCDQRPFILGSGFGHFSEMLLS